MTRFLNRSQVGEKLKGNKSYFTKAKREQLEREGFPMKDPLFSAWDNDAIDAWLDARAGINMGETSGVKINVEELYA